MQALWSLRLGRSFGLVVCVEEENEGDEGRVGKNSGMLWWTRK